MIVNFAERAHNHNWELDPVVRSLLDTDFYKLLMLPFIWKHYAKTRCRSHLFVEPLYGASADMFATEEVPSSWNVRKLRFRRSELVWLASNHVLWATWDFRTGILEWLEQDFTAYPTMTVRQRCVPRCRCEGYWLNPPYAGTLCALCLDELDRQHEKTNGSKSSIFSPPGENETLEQGLTPLRGLPIWSRGFAAEDKRRHNSWQVRWSKR